MFKCLYCRLPGVPPTGKHVRVPFVAVVNVRGDKLYHEHIYWYVWFACIRIFGFDSTMAQGPSVRVGADRIVT